MPTEKTPPHIHLTEADLSLMHSGDCGNELCPVCGWFPEQIQWFKDTAGSVPATEVVKLLQAGQKVIGQALAAPLRAEAAPTKEDRGVLAGRLRELCAKIREWKRTGVDAIPSERELRLIHRASLALESPAPDVLQRVREAAMLGLSWGAGQAVMEKENALRDIYAMCAQTLPATVPAPAPAQVVESCEGRYPVPMQRDEPFPVTYRCDKQKGHEGPCGPTPDAAPAPAREQAEVQKQQPGYRGGRGGAYGDD